MRSRHSSSSASRIAILAALCAANLLTGMALGQRAPDLDRGKAVFDHWCAPCHAAGPGHPGTQSLQLKYDGNLPAVLEERSDLTPEAIKVFVRQGVLSMAPFRKTEITDAELEHLAAYLGKAR